LNRYTLIGLAIGLVIGIFIGYEAGQTTTPAAPPPGAMQGMPPGGVPPQGAPGGAGPDVQARIATLQQIVAKDPKNVRAWIDLGNDFFDTHQPQKAVEAYGRALELDPKNPNVLTDQGVMYRELGQFDRAIANFEKAYQADPKHVQSVFNEGVVYLNDLKNPDKAAAAWKRVVQIAPDSPQAAEAKRALDAIKAGAVPGAPGR
jgi:tetratricopeptide (TPR) repeat protein